MNFGWKVSGEQYIMECLIGYYQNWSALFWKLSSDISFQPWEFRELRSVELKINLKKISN